MTYTAAEARAKAKQIFERFGGQVHEACAGSLVPEDFLGGFIGVEAGIDKHGEIKTGATRFEPGVYHYLLAVRDGLLAAYNKIHKSDLTGLSDDAIRNLSTSWGVTQIMGWHLVHNLTGTVADLRDPDKHLGYSVELLTLTARPYLKAKDFSSVLRIWNSGSANGKTYDPNYVPNALSVKAQYAALMNANQGRYLLESSAAQTQDPDTADIGSASAVVSAPASSEGNPENEPPTSSESPESSGSPGSSGSSGSPEKFDAFVPQIDTAKTWIKRATAGTFLGTILAKLTGLPEWMQMGLFGLLVLVVIGAVVILVKYHSEIFAYVTKMNTLRATAGVSDPIVAGRPPTN